MGRPWLLVAIILAGTACGYRYGPTPRTPAGGVESPRAYRSHDAAVRKRFAADAHCADDKVVVEDMGKGVFRAEGCGRSDFYRCEGMGEPSCAVHKP